MKKKRTAATTAKMAAARRQGATMAEIAARHGVGVATVHAALKAPSTGKAKAKARKAPPLAQETRGEPLPAPTREELAVYLGAQMRALRADLEASDDASAKGAINRNLVATQALLSRVLPPEPLDPTVGVFVDAAEMTALGAEVEARMLKMLDLVLEDTDPAPACSACLRAFGATP